VTVTGTYRFFNDVGAGLQAAVIFGVKAPTGRTNATDADGVLFETEHQPGSGSWDGVFGGSLSRQMGQTTFSANAVYTRAGAGSQDTRLGDRLAYGLTASYLLSGEAGSGGASRLGGPFDGMMRHGGVDHAAKPPPAPTLTVSLGLNGQWSGRQTIAGERDDNTGGNTLFLTPGVSMTLDKWTTFVNVGIPVARQINGIQSDPALQVSSGISVRF